MTTEAQSVPIEAFRQLATLQQLALEASLSRSRQQLIYRILNRSIELVPYQRAVLMDPQGRLLGVSGQVDLAPHAPLPLRWRRLLNRLAADGQSMIVRAGSFDREGRALWEDLAKETEGLEVFLTPLLVDDRVVAWLWLERWGASAMWQEAEGKQLASLVASYGAAWRSFRGGGWRFWCRRRGVLLVAAVVVMLLLLVIHVPLRVVAPCEVVPLDPVELTAPLEGVIDRITVPPGQAVAAGEVVARYDARDTEWTLRATEQEVRVLESELRRRKVRALDAEDPEARAQIAVLENRLRQGRIRLASAKERAERLEVRAPAAGVVVVEDPASWRGRPVQIGQRILTIVDTKASKVRISIPENDYLAFDLQTEPIVFLDSDPGVSRSIRLRWINPLAEVDARGATTFAAEANWSAPQENLTLGARGQAVLYGRRVPLLYWLLRKPWLAVRSLLGV